MTSVFPDWKKFAVHQRRPETGCIAAGYEMILRAVGATHVDFAAFQDDFDFDKDRAPNDSPRNTFQSVATAVHERYPGVTFTCRTFPKGRGAAKLAFVVQCLTAQRPVLASISKVHFKQNGWHIMPIVDATSDKLFLLNHVSAAGNIDTIPLTTSEFVSIHEQYPGGDDIAYLESGW